MASLTQWTWVWVNSGSWYWTGRPGVLWFMGSQRVGHDWATDLIWSDHLVGSPPLPLDIGYLFWWDPTFSCWWLFSSKLQFWSSRRRRWAHILLLHHLTTFRCTDVWNSPASYCAGKKHLYWVVDALLVVCRLKGRDKSNFCYPAMFLTSPLFLFFLIVYF